MSEKSSRRSSSPDCNWCAHASQRRSENRNLSPFHPNWCPDAFRVEILERTEAGIIQEISSRLRIIEPTILKLTNLICAEREIEWDHLPDFLVRQEVVSDLLKQSRAAPDVARKQILAYYNNRCRLKALE